MTLAPEPLPRGALGSARGDRAPVRLVRDGPVPEASCPHCGGQLELSTVGSRWKVRWPSDVADRLMLQLGTLEREEVHVLLLDARNVVLEQVRVYQGNVSESVVRVGELFTEAVRRHARSVLLVHNHPSGNPTPSPEDLNLTAAAIAAGRLLDVHVLDHIVIGGGTFVSLRERGVAFERTDAHAAGNRPGTALATWNAGSSSAPTAAKERTSPGALTVLEVVGPEWLTCLCTHGRPLHREQSPEAGLCLVVGCLCPAYERARSAPEDLGAPEYSQAWEPLRAHSTVLTDA